MTVQYSDCIVICTTTVSIYAHVPYCFQCFCNASMSPASGAAERVFQFEFEGRCHRKCFWDLPLATVSGLCHHPLATFELVLGQVQFVSTYSLLAVFLFFYWFIFHSAWWRFIRTETLHCILSFFSVNSSLNSTFKKENYSCLSSFENQLPHQVTFWIL